MIKKIILQIIVGILGLFIASEFISGVEINGPIQVLLFAGTVLGLANFFLKPILKFITFPLRILTLGLFGLIINMGLIWGIDVLFGSEIEIKGIIPLFLTTVIVWITSYITSLILK